MNETYRHRAARRQKQARHYHELARRWIEAAEEHRPGPIRESYLAIAGHAQQISAVFAYQARAILFTLDRGA